MFVFGGKMKIVYRKILGLVWMYSKRVLKIVLIIFRNKILYNGYYSFNNSSKPILNNPFFITVK